LAGILPAQADDLAALQALIVQTGARLVVIDAFVDVIRGLDENSAGDVQMVFHGLRSVASATGCVFIVIHHLNKAGQQRGSTALPGAVDLLLRATRATDGRRIEFCSEKERNVERVKFAGELSWSPGRFVLGVAEAGTGPAPTFGKGQKHVMEYLREHGPTSIQTVINAASICSPRTARNALFELAEAGLIARIDGGGTGASAIYALHGNGDA